MSTDFSSTGASQGAPDSDRSRPHPTRTHLRRRLQQRWRRARRAYRSAGQPFGSSVRGLEVWIEYGRCARTN